jgi:hypothetical protein
VQPRALAVAIHVKYFRRDQQEYAVVIRHSIASSVMRYIRLQNDLTSARTRVRSWSQRRMMSASSIVRRSCTRATSAWC